MINHDALSKFESAKIEDIKYNVNEDPIYEDNMLTDLPLSAHEVTEGMTIGDREALSALDITLPMGYQQLKVYLPHRYPFMLVDRVTACCPLKSITGHKNVTINEPFFQGHFPNDPIMPGVLIIEAMAQLAGILASIYRGKPTEDGCLFLFGGADKVRFKKPVVPGDQLELRAQLELVKNDIYKFSCQAKVDNTVVALAKVMLVLQHHRDIAHIK